MQESQKKEGEPETEIKKQEPPITLNNLYTIFWQLQHDFADPTRLFQEANFERFKTGLAAPHAPTYRKS